MKKHAMKKHAMKKHAMKKHTVTWLLTALLLLPLTVRHTPQSVTATAVPAAVSPMPGGLAPDFTLPDFAGRPLKLSDYRGKPVLLNFWASWCGPCQQEFPDLAALARHYDGNVQFLGVNLTDQDDPQVAAALLSQHQIKYRNALDKDGTVAATYKIMAIPTTLLLNAQGRIVQRLQGPINSQVVDGVFKNLVVK